MPKYQQIFEQLRAEIADKTIKANSYLPSENELMKKYDASRDTIRNLYH